MATKWDLARLRYTIRKITGMMDVTQLPDSTVGVPSIDNPPGLDDYINDFYLLDMDEHLRVLKLKQYLIFTTLPNVGTYAIPQTYFQLEPPFYVDNYVSGWHQSPDAFYRIWPELEFIQRSVFQGDGTTTIFSFTLSQKPIIQGSVVIGSSEETFTDQDQALAINTDELLTNPGILTGSQGSTGIINYLTGAVTITAQSAYASGTQFNAHYRPYVASRPRDALFYQQNIYLRPIPNDTYQIKVLCYIQPTVLLSGGGTGDEFNASDVAATPLFNEWWQVIAYGAALKILIQEGDHEEVARQKPYFEEAKMLAQRRTLKQLANQRIPTVYSDNSNSVAYPLYPYY